MSGRRLHTLPAPTQPTPIDSGPIRSHDHALKTLDDGPYLAYVAVQTAKFAISLIVKRWAQFR